MSNKRKYAIIAAGCIVIMVVGVVIFWRDFFLYRHTVTIGDASVRVRVARDAWQQRLGLGGTVRMCATCGMYFRFATTAPHTLWMRGMCMDIDALWIADGRVVAMATQMQWRRGTADVRAPHVAADAVVEVPVGFIDAHSIRIGDAVVVHDIE